MKKLLLVFCILIESANAEFVLVDYKDQKHLFEKNKNDRIVSVECLKKECSANTFHFKKVKIKDGEDPAAVACLETKQAKIIQMHDGKHNEESVCLFDDGSMLTFGSMRILVSD
ncbi:MAG: hypothetical protein COW00_10120 [Bdellovibrio sp. CG12_big_fil_rev_8_21_14_0_65_39_13]|nr:MAG: hypothetical protein COW78_01195 [Bdellovibrio sp. CG22_combo_CG10-13_8_21_14_all_39_27]PIQ59467.1 MAG: hypothetical protein COW00_10120 [Bdellovibrio sp. CG12_big_fil_rev_8_21_14_0_65_39_13]PIR36597.1 MAG: hypothetical protein COV37_02850 [Bdellovibrio sp. CG11_big_fil_rev_8_21_14_0_20_39_38]PJB53920.1 MAG: hypothetical protein CO099_04340 [Bdellovibrio sp. CG_4_9_14_3_um_filter_39_7]